MQADASSASSVSPAGRPPSGTKSRPSPFAASAGTAAAGLGGNILSMYYSGGCGIDTALNTGRIGAGYIAASL